jgi:hypothetical protein
MLLCDELMHELCSLLMYIPIYFDVIIMFCIDSWGFFINSPYFGYNNSIEQEIPVLCILTFQGPSGTQIDRGFF